MRDLLSDPAWQEDDLGFPLPDSPHACLVSLPTWQSVIGYEESRPEVVDKMRAGYPRFFLHPITRALFSELEKRLATGDERVLAYATTAAASRASHFVERRSGCRGRLVEVEGLSALIVPPAGYEAARDYWRHTGEIVSSRQAEDFLAGRMAQPESPESFCESMARVMEVPARDLFVFESGMAAAFAIYRGLVALHPGRKTLQLCFPYVDVLKIQQHFGVGADLVQDTRGEGFKMTLNAIRAGAYSAVFCEVPSNPLLSTVDLQAVSDACRESETPLVVDDTVCSHLNVETLSLADAVSTSLTKWVSGIGDVLAGSVRINAASPHAGHLRAALESDAPGGSRLYARDARKLLENTEGFAERVKVSNERGEEVADYLAGHPAVASVYYPKFVDRQCYAELRRSDGGYGGLLSFTLVNPERAPVVYEAMRFSKGPSLGTEYSLLCPYTLLAHYTELEWARECGVMPELLRLSVGKEEAADLLARLEHGLSVA